MTNIHELLDEYARIAPDRRAKGHYFELLVKRYLENEPLYQGEFENVWLWSEWPGRDGKPDTGIDLVAQRRHGGGLCAIQCKFFAPGSVVQKGDIDSFISASARRVFTERIVVSTTEKWSKNAVDTLDGLLPAIRRLGMSDLEQSVIDWSAYRLDQPDEVTVKQRHQLRDHQVLALGDVLTGFDENERGQLIMACGTGKTLTSLRIAERLAGPGGSVLFLVPSIALLAQTLREWSQQADGPLRSFAVCSDRQVGKDAEDLRIRDLEIPASTTADSLLGALTKPGPRGAMTVFFSTYQSIGVVHAAQEAGVDPFDLVICDEAHRTAGVVGSEDVDRSDFVRVHDPSYIRAERRLYMTATPRLFADSAKRKADEGGVTVASMDDPAVFGPEFHHLKFGAAVEQNLLSDYKVLVLAVSEDAVNEGFQKQFAASDGDLTLSDAARIAGIYKAFSKTAIEGLDDAAMQPMRRAVAFAENIAISKHVKAMLDDNAALSKAVPRREADLVMRAEHVDGGMDILRRNRALEWLKGDIRGNETRILTNARCLSEGVDVPALDAVVFLNPRRSIVDIVQSVGRVMRRAPGKDYGYVIIPVAIPAGVEPEKALDDNDRFRVVWQVLQALRAHDERLEATIEAIRLNPSGGTNGQIQTIGIQKFTPSRDDDEQQGATRQAQLDFTPLGPEWTDAIYAKLVRKVGQREYWENWARDVAGVAERQRLRLEGLLEAKANVRRDFERFVKGLRANLNESITDDDALDMLAQHIITEPVLEILFEGFDFAASNPVAAAMNRMLRSLDGSNVDSERSELVDFYAGVRRSVGQITDARGKQRFLKQLYERFFRIAMRRAADRLGIVYTPNEIVDFILRSVDELSREHFGRALADEGVHILDPFTGTGTFLAQLILDEELMPAHALPHKFRNELWANEINLLAYYVAAANLEQAYRSRMGGNYVAFPHIALTDTFQNTENGDALDGDGVFETNNAVVVAETEAPISIIVGNPPYSKGQSSGNDDNQNLSYPTLDARIKSTYAARSTAQNKNNLYDSYIRAIRWASDRIAQDGIVAFVTNGGFVESMTADGMRKVLEEEFSDIYIYNLRGNTRTAGEQALKEGGQTFGSASRATIVLAILVKHHTREQPGTVLYSQVDDYLTTAQKLAGLKALRTVDKVAWSPVIRNEHGDWLGTRSDAFGTFTPLSNAIVRVHSGGLRSARDAWAYNASASAVMNAMTGLIDQYSSDLERFEATGEAILTLDPTRISWSDGLKRRFSNRERLSPTDCLRPAMYRPFEKRYAYFDTRLLERTYRLLSIAPAPTVPVQGFYQVGMASVVPFSVLMVDVIPDGHLTGAGSGGQFFPRYTYERRTTDSDQLDIGDSSPSDEYTRIDNVTDGILDDYRSTYGDPSITKDDVFFYVYGVPHSPEYRDRFAADLKKMLPRIPKAADFFAFVDAGRRLSELHLGYETVSPWPLEECVTGRPTDEELLRVTKMRFASRADRSAVVVNEHLTLAGIPDAAHRYLLGSRSALEWILERYQIKTDKASGIVNDPNSWGTEHDDPGYTVELLKRITRVSVETVAIVDSLPSLGIRGVDDVPAEGLQPEVGA